METETKIKLTELLDLAGITMQVQPDYSASSLSCGTCWTATFTNSNGAMLRTPFHQGSALKEEPTRELVMQCLAMDAAGYENAPDFDDWANEYGYSTDSRAAYSTWQQVESTSKELEYLMGEHYTTLLWDTELD